MKNIEIAIVVGALLAIGFICYYIGYGQGNLDMATLVLNHIPEMLDIEFSERAKIVMAGNENILRMALTQESFRKLLEDFSNLTAYSYKGGIGPEGFGRIIEWNLSLEQGDT